jgi:hypothetical protein
VKGSFCLSRLQIQSLALNAIWGDFSLFAQALRLLCDALI